jgi:hypothetical protein
MSTICAAESHITGYHKYCAITRSSPPSGG